MKFVYSAVLVAGLMLAASSAYAGLACCASKGAGKADKAAMSSCSKATAGLDLTAEQKAKIATIEESCKAAGSTEEACSKAKSDIRDVLTDDQKAAFDAACEKASSKKAGGGCG